MTAKKTGRHRKRGAPKSEPPSGERRVRVGPKKGGWTSTAWWVGFVFASSIAASLTAILIVYPASSGPGSGRDVELVVPGDESADGLAGRLFAAGLVGSPKAFALYLRLTGGASKVVPGVHLLTDDLSPATLLSRLERTHGGGHVKVTIPEGFTRFDVARRLQALRVCPLRAWLDATTDPALLAELHIEGASAEGYLFPATYDLALDSAAPDVVRRLKGEFDKRYADLEASHQAGLLDLSTTLGWGQKEIVTLASMVEKEAAVDDERPIVASVFVNRLRDPSFVPKLLQCDPTAGYGCLVAPELAPSCASYAGKITHDIVSDAGNPYNTYKHEGLPPGPIANPGARSLEGAMAPAMTRFLYFVARGEGRHTFSETYGAHAAAIKGGHTGLKSGAGGPDGGTR
jgi:UPF0755 protein